MSGLALLATALPSAAAVSGGAGPVGGPARFDAPLEGFSPRGTVLRAGTPAEAGLDPEPIDAALADIARWTDEPADPAGTRPLYSGAVSVLGSGGTVVSKEATGLAVRYADGEGTELPAAEQVPMRTDTVVDLASVSKLFTSIVVVQQVEAGRVELDEPVATYVPEFAANGKEDVTVRNLLTHTGGLPSWIPLWSGWDTPEERLQAALTVEPTTPPGTAYVYSDLSLIALATVAERVTGDPLDVLVRDGVTAPLGMTDTGYNPDAERAARAAATEYQSAPDRGMVRGEVHDENAWALGGVAGHAGVFSTADDLAVLAQTLLNGGVYRGARILSEQGVTAMLTDENTAFPGNEHGLGFELDQRWYMGALSGPRTAGHTGYTGTSFVLDYASGSFAILLTNRVHPSREWGSINVARARLSDALATAMAVLPPRGADAWQASVAPDTTSTITAEVPAGPHGSTIAFSLFLDTDDADVFALEASVDGGSTWAGVPFTARGGGERITSDGEISASGHRRWWQVRATGPVGEDGAPVLLRWRHSTDGSLRGRGVLVDHVVATVRGSGTVLDGERDPEAFQLDGWTPVTR